MLRPPPIQSAPHYPVTSAIAAGAIVVSVMRWSGQDVDASYMDYNVWDRWQLWRALTATFPHGDAFHLLFNLYWLWTFGTLIERGFGHLKSAAIYLLFAFGSMLADFAVSNGGIGLSGVGYGLWGMLAVLERHDFRFADAVDRQTNQIFIGWFFLCIVLTVTGWLPVANVAHGVGAVLGMLLGLAVAGEGAARWTSRAGLVVLMVMILLGSTVFWPRVNLSGNAVIGIEYAGIQALARNNVSHGVNLLEIAVKKKNAAAHTWYNLGVAYSQAGRDRDAAAAFEHAAQMPDADDEMKAAARAERLHPVIINTNRP
jgi:membrane associated rhomboid family serine protease